MKVAFDHINEFVSRINLMLAASAVILSIYFLTSLIRPFYIIPTAFTPGGQEESVSLRDPLTLIPGFSMDVFKQKNLFPLSSGAREEKARHDFVLIGVSMGEKKLASVRDTGTQKVYYFSAGDTIEDFRVVEITNDKVVLEGEDGRVEITR